MTWLLRDVLARVQRALDALEDGDMDLAVAILADVLLDVPAAVHPDAA